jgi:hypothetical protein
MESGVRWMEAMEALSPHSLVMILHKLQMNRTRTRTLSCGTLLLRHRPFFIFNPSVNSRQNEIKTELFLDNGRHSLRTRGAS